jgi:hypothetical protein
MKNSLFALICILAFATQAQSQKAAFTDGTISYVIKSKGSKDSQLAMLEGSTFTAFFKNGMSKITGDLLGGLMGIKFTLDDAKKEGVMLMDMMAQRKAVRIDKSNYDDVSKSVKDKPKITKTKSSKTIAGYSCQKTIISNPDGSKITAYVCNSIQPKNNALMQSLVGNLQGFPLSLEFTDPDGGILQVIATKVSNVAPDDKEFSMLIPSQYQMTTLKELQKMTGAE